MDVFDVILHSLGNDSNLTVSAYLRVHRLPVDVFLSGRGNLFGDLYQCGDASDNAKCFRHVEIDLK